jgi:PAS domain S-box-containing protein
VAGKVDYANARWSEIAGISPYDEAGIRASVHPEDRPALQAMWRDALAKGTGFQSEFRFVHPDGTTVWTSTNTAPVRDAAGRLTGFVGTVEDVGVRRRAEEERIRTHAAEAQLARLQEMERFRSDFLNNAAHELRTPVLPMRAQLLILRARLGPGLGDGDRRSLEVVERNLARMSGLVEELLESARVQSGRMELRPARCDLHALVAEAVESFQPAATERQVVLMQASRGDGVAVVDAPRIGQVLYNLLSNATKFTPPGGRIQVESEGGPEHVEVCVHDTGAGIRPDDLPRLFQPFTQVHDAEDRSRGGAGLGLYISKAIADLHGGTISAESAGRGQGTRFTLRVPRASPAGPPAGQPVGEGPGLSAPAHR